MKSEGLLIKLGFLLLCVIWGSTWLAIKIGLESVPPFYSIAIRFFIAAVVLFFIMKWRGLRVPRDRQSWRLFVAVGLLSFSLPFCIIYWSEQFLPSGLMSILFAVFPFSVAILSHFFLPEEPLNAFKLAGIALGFAGIVVIFSNGFSGNGEVHQFAPFGMLATVGATFLQASSMILIKKRGKEISPITLNYAGILVGTLVTALVAVAMEEFSDIRFDAKAIGSILYLGTFGSVVTFVVYFWLLKRMQAVFLSLMTFITPITAVLLGAVVLNETLEPNIFFGAAMVLVGILLANGRGLMSVLLKALNKKSAVG